jgi:pimeloyl-ACP methyl ester carboxylesterase
MLADVTYKKDNKKKPVVLFCHGFKGFKDWGCFNLVAEQFAKKGFVFIKFNFSHNGTTPENPIDFVDLEAFGHNSFKKELADIDFILNYLQSSDEAFLQEADLENIVLIGHSRGGGVGTLYTSNDVRIKKLITWAAVSDFERMFPKGVYEQWKKEGVYYVYNGRTEQNMPLYYDQVVEFFRNSDTYNILKAAKQINKPWLIVHGTNDETVPLQDALDLKIACESAELITIKNGDHVFSASHPWTENTLPEDLDFVVKESIEFLLR